MKQKINFPTLTLLFFVFLLITSQALARVLASKQGKEELKLNEVPSKSSLAEIQEQNFQELMGSEGCHNGDEECLKRRTIAEAHLDYIYTQHQRP